jgi:hypothetical protein
VLTRFRIANVQLDVVDVADGECPAEVLEEDRVIVTPTLVRSHPLPKVWIYGDLSKTDLVDSMIATALQHDTV